MAEEEWSDQDLVEYEDWIHSESISEPILNKVHNNKSEFLNEIEAIESRIQQFQMSLIEGNTNYHDMAIVRQEEQSFDYNFKQVVYTLKANVLPSEIIMDIVASYLLQGQYWESPNQKTLTLADLYNPEKEHTFVKKLLFNTNNLFADYWYTNPYETVALNYLKVYENSSIPICYAKSNHEKGETMLTKAEAKSKWIQEKGENMLTKARKLQLV